MHLLVLGQEQPGRLVLTTSGRVNHGTVFQVNSHGDLVDVLREHAAWAVEEIQKGL